MRRDCVASDLPKGKAERGGGGSFFTGNGWGDPCLDSPYNHDFIIFDE
jgi:hypothetical protein